MLPWALFGCWPVLGAFALVAWACRQPAPPETKAAEDVEQAAYLAEWNAARMRYIERKAARDSRGQNAAAKAVKRACTAALRAEVSR
jgi:hypothetical protein